MILKIILLSLVGITALYAILSAIDNTLYQHRVVKVEKKLGEVKSVYFLIQNRFLLFFWKNAKFYSVKLSKNSKSYYSEVLYKTEIQFKTLSDAQDRFYRIHIFKYRGVKIYRIYDYKRMMYDATKYVTNGKVSEYNYYTTGFVILGHKRIINSIHKYLDDAEKFIDSKIPIVTKTVVFP